MRNGKDLERFTKLIQDTLKDKTDTEVLLNHRLENVDGDKREFDVLINSKLNGFDIVIAIECKDYSSPVPVEKIEAFNSKCLGVKEISKMVFVSSNGYQSGAIKTAKRFNIDLYTFTDISVKDIDNLFIPVKGLLPKIKVELPITITLDHDDEHISEINFDTDNEPILYFYEDIKSIPISYYVWNNIVVKEGKNIQAYMSYYFMKGDKKAILPYTAKMGGIFIYDKLKNKYNVTGIKGNIIGWYEKNEIEISKAKSYKKIGNSAEANLKSYLFSKDKELAIVSTNNKASFFYTDEKGETQELKHLSTYDPKTDTFTNPDE